MKRRSFLLAAASIAFVPSPSATPYSSPSYLDGLTARLAHNEAQLGGAPLAREAARHVARAVPAAQSGSAPLRAAASRLCRQAALILHDVRKLDQAERTAADALSLAQSAGDPAGQAGALEVLSLITAHLPDGRGAAYARRGLALPGTAAGDRAVLAARLGRSLALSPGHGQQARAHLEDALELAGHTAEITGNAGIGLADLGLAGRADRCLADAVAMSAGSPFMSSLYTARRAKAAIRARQPEQAAPLMLTLAGLAPLVDSPRLTIHLRHITDGTRKWDTISEIRDARSALKEAMA